MVREGTNVAQQICEVEIEGVCVGSGMDIACFGGVGRTAKSEREREYGPELDLHGAPSPSQ